MIIATLGSILDFQLCWKSGKFQLVRWSHNVALLSAGIFFHLLRMLRELTHPRHYFKCLLRWTIATLGSSYFYFYITLKRKFGIQQNKEQQPIMDFENGVIVKIYKS